MASRIDFGIHKESASQLASFILTSGLITEQQLNQAVIASDESNRGLMETILEFGFTVEEEIADDAEKKARSDARPAREMEQIRNHRNNLLVETDWTGISDLTMSDTMKTYRQELRDIPASNTVYADVTWPTKPE